METRALPLAARGVTKHFGGVAAVDGVTLEFPDRTVTAIVGDNGAGKSTLIKLLSGVHQPNDGHIEVDGRPVAFHRPHDAQMHGIETVYQDLALADHRDVASNLFLGREPTVGYGPFRFVRRRTMRAESERTLAELNVKVPSMRTEVRKLSGGQRQGIAIGRALHRGSRVLIMDEPVAALGIHETERFTNLVRQLAERGLTQILISHNLDHVFSLSSRIAVMRQGRLVAVLETSATDRQEIVHLIAGLPAAASG